MSSLCIKANLPTALPADNNLTLHGFGNVHTLSHANAHRSANPLERCRSIPNRTRPVDNRQAACRRPLTLLVEWAGLVAETPGLAWDKSNGIERCGTNLTR